MTATTPNITEAAQMPTTPTPPEAPAEASAAAAPATTGRSRWAILGDHPVLTVIATGIVTLFATLSVGLLIYVLNRIDSLEDTMYAGFAEQDEKIDERFAELDLRLTTQIAELDLRLTTQIAELDLRLTTQIAELDRKLTALIAALNRTDQVDAAMEGRLLNSEPPVDDPSAPPG